MTPAGEERRDAAGVALRTLAVAQVGANEVATFSVAAGAYGDIRFKALHVQLQGTARTSGGTIRLAELDAGGQIQRHQAARPYAHICHWQLE